MSWIDKEIKRRAARAPQAQTRVKPGAESEPEKLAALWSRLQAVNDELPGELRLQPGPPPPTAVAEGAKFSAWLCAPNGAAFGFAGDAIRYAWPVADPKKSNNFWIRWHPERRRYVVVRRIGAATAVRMVEYRVKEPRVEYLIKCLVMGKRIKPQAVRRRRLWLF